jgi:GTPase SAR1 family protein
MDERHLADALAAQAASAGAGRLRVLVLGEFKRGKSTLINALLGEEVLPAYALPTTSTFVEIKWGEQKRVVVHSRIPPSPRNPGHTSGEVQDQFPTSVISQAIEIPIDRLEQYLVVQDTGGHSLETHYDRIEIFWPVDLLKNGIDIIDTPGINEHGIQTRLAVEYLSTADAIVFVMSCSALASQTEIEYLDTQLQGRGQENVFLVCNRFDQVRPDDRPRLIHYAHERLADKTRLGADGIFFISALEALEGRASHDAATVELSGIGRLEQALGHYLVENRDRVKILCLINNLASVIRRSIAQGIPTRRLMLEQDMNALTGRRDEARLPLDRAKKCIETTREQINGFRQVLRQEIQQETLTHFRWLADQVPRWMHELYVANPVTALKLWSFKGRSNDLAREMVRRLSERLEAEVLKWQQKRLQPIIERHLATAISGLHTLLSEFMTALGEIQIILNVEGGPIESRPSPGDLLRRVLAQAGGFPVSASNEIGGHLSISMLASGVSTPLLMLANPLATLEVFGNVLLSSIFQGGAFMENAKHKVGQATAEYLRREARYRADAMAEAVDRQLDRIGTEICDALVREVNHADRMLINAIEAKRTGGIQVTELRALLTELEGQLRGLDFELVDLIADLN